jgi:hypothetical protein
MDFTPEQQAVIDTIIQEATTKAQEGFFTKEQLDTEVGKAREGLLSKEDLDKTIQSETDKVRTEYSKKLKSLEDEIVKYKPVEKSDAEKQLEARELEISKKEKMFKVKESLSQNNLPSDLYDVIYGELDDDARVSKLSDILNNVVLDGSFKGSKKHTKSDSITKDQFKKMSYAERTKLYNDNPSLYNELVK